MRKSKIIYGKANKRLEKMVFKGNYDKKLSKVQLWYPFLILPCYIFLCLCIEIQELFLVFFETMPNPMILLSFTALLGVFLSCVLLLCYKYRIAKEEYKQLIRLKKVQELHYTGILEKRQELERLKEDFVSQLGEIIIRLESGSYLTAVDELDCLTRRIQETSEYPFCSNAVINSILTKVGKDCRKNSIRFHVELLIGDCSKISNLHLCSIFSNLLDNAINGCSIIAEEESRYILVKAKQDENYIHISVVNTAPPVMPDRTKQDGHGYGQKILRDIAKKYNGDFSTSYENGEYKAFISLCISMKSL